MQHSSKWIKNTGGGAEFTVTQDLERVNCVIHTGTKYRIHKKTNPVQRGEAGKIKINGEHKLMRKFTQCQNTSFKE